MNGTSRNRETKGERMPLNRPYRIALFCNAENTSGPLALLYISKQIGWSDLSRGIATLTRKTKQPINCSWTLCPFKRCGTTRRQRTWSRPNWKYLVTAFTAAAAAAASKSVCPRSSLKARIKLFNLDSVRVTRMKNLIEDRNRRRGAGRAERRVSVC